MERSSNVEQKGEAGRRGKRKFRVRRRGREGVSIPLTIHLRGNPTNFPPFLHPSQLGMLKLSHQRGVVNITRDLYLLMPLVETPWFVELDLRLEFSRFRDGIMKRRNWISRAMENFTFNSNKKTHPDLIFHGKKYLNKRYISIRTFDRNRNSTPSV